MQMCSWLRETCGAEPHLYQKPARDSQIVGSGKMRGAKWDLQSLAVQAANPSVLGLLAAQAAAHSHFLHPEKGFSCATLPPARCCQQGPCSQQS